MKSERQFKFLTGCKTNGTTNLELENICSDPECYSCSSFRKLFIEEVEKQINNK